MKKILTTLLFFVSFSLVACDNGYDLKIPDRVPIVRNADVKQFTGTRVFITLPDTYKEIPQLLRYQKNEKTYLQVFEMKEKKDFSKFKKEVFEKSEQMKKSGRLEEEYYKKEFRLGTYDALLVHGPDSRRGLDQMLLAFGNGEFLVMATAVLPSGDEKVRWEVRDALLTLGIDTNAQPDMTALQTYDIDLEGTEFKFAENFSQMFVYTVDGTKFNTDRKDQDAMIISSLPGMDPKKMKAFSLDMLRRYQANDEISIPRYDEKELIVSGNYGYEISFRCPIDGKECLVYQLVTGNEQAAVILQGTLSGSRRNELMKQVRAAAKTLSIK